MILEIDHEDPGIVPGDVVPGGVLAKQPPLDDPVDLAIEAIGIVLQAIEHVLPLGHSLA